MKKFLLLPILLFAFNAQAQFWTAKSTGFATMSRGVDDISIVDASTVWVKAYDGSGNEEATVKEIARSTDGGNTWTPVVMSGFGSPGATLALSSICAVSSTVAYVTAYPTAAATGGIWKVTWTGATPTYTKQASALYNQAESFANLVHFWDANNGVSQGDPQGGYFEIYTTSNGGDTWTRVPSANIPAPLAGEYGYVHNLDVVGDIIWFGTNKGRLYKSVNKGLNWTVSQTPVTDFAGLTQSGSYSFSTATKGILSTDTYNLYSTNDGGVTWTPIVTSGFFGDLDIEYIPGSSVVLATSTFATGEATFYSYDDGVTWQNTDQDKFVTEIEFLNGTVGYGGGFTTSPTAGGIFKYTGANLRVYNMEMATLAAYPNPTNGMLTISGAPIQSVVVMDLLGKQVLSSEFNAVDNPEIDLSALQTGAYLLKATSDTGAIQTIKIMKN